VFSLTERDREILETLTLKIRFLSVSQVARTWWADSANSVANARARLKALEQAGLIVRFTTIAHPEIELASPIAVWEPGDRAPDFGSASWRLKSRWTKPPAATPSVIATKGAGHQFAGFGGRYPRPTEQTHDLHVAALYLGFRLLRPDEARAWVSEEILRADLRGADKLPDAMIRAGDSKRVIEFGGAYGKPKLASFHRFCAELELPYELW
jgi:hypothetical protein